MNLLQIVQAVCGELGLPIPGAIVSSGDPQIVQLFALANKVGSDLSTDSNWSGLVKEYRFQTVAIQTTGTVFSGGSEIIGIPTTAGIIPGYFVVDGAGFRSDSLVKSVDSNSQVTMDSVSASSVSSGDLLFSKVKYDMPADYDRVVHRTQWDKTNHWEMSGPQSPQQWQYLKGGIVSAGPRLRYRIIGDTFQVWPPPPNNSTLGFEYVSKSWVTASNGDPRYLFFRDDDVCAFRDRTMISGIKYEFFSIKGFDTTALYRDYLAQTQKEMAMDHSAPTLSLSSMEMQFVGPASVPETGFGK